MRAALVLLVLLAVGAGAAWQYTGRAATPPGWKLAAATRGPIQSAVLATGTLKPVVTVQVGSQISGQIVKLEAD
ncbi:MAG: HlyD family secretion protein, partial [Pseudomonadota bacterium]|nr:HlyD family secretion protein [Pseudomonadota bacterium]